MSRAGNSMDFLSLDQLLNIVTALKKQLNATKTVYFSHRGIVTDSRVLPDHKAQLRAVIELAKLYGLYPRRGEQQSGNPQGGSEQPVINLVMPRPDGMK